MSKYNDPLLDYAVPAQKKFAEVYDDDNSGLISIADSYVQVTHEKFAELVDKLHVMYSGEKAYQDYHLSFLLDGTEIHAVFSKEEMQEFGMEI